MTNRIDELQAKIEELQKEIEEARKECKKDEWPKRGDEYYFINSHGIINDYIYQGNIIDIYNKKIGNMHKTEDEAEKYRDWLMSPITQARRKVEMMPGFDSKGCWYLYMDENDYIKVGNSLVKCGQLSFITLTSAFNAIENLGEETIKLALGIE